MGMPLQIVLALPVFAGILLLSILWVLQILRERRGDRLRERRRAGMRVYECVDCRLVYVDARPVPAVACPQCGVLNEARIR